MTEPRPDWEITAPLRVFTIPGCPDGQSPLNCLNCRSLLDIHQPDGELPDRMLATCPECRAWHLIECAPDVDALIVLLPDSVSLRQVPNPGRPASESGITRVTDGPR